MSIPGGEVELRSCHSEDIEAVLDFWKRAGAVPRPTDDLQGLRTRLEWDDALFVLAIAEGRIVGTLLGAWDGWRGNMYRLVVAPEHRRQGLARRMVARVEDAMRALGVRRVTSLVLAEEAGAEELWASAGYVRDESVARYAKDLR